MLNVIPVISILSNPDPAKRKPKKVEWKLADTIGQGAVLCLSMFMVKISCMLHVRLTALIDGGLIIHGQHLGYILRENPIAVNLVSKNLQR